MNDKTIRDLPCTAPDLQANRLLTPAQVAEMLGVSEATLSGWRCRGRYSLPYVKIGSRVMYRPQAVENFVLERERGTKGRG